MLAFSGLLLLAVGLWNVNSSPAGSSGCTENCDDYHRMCPGVKDQAFYDDYAEKHETGALGELSNGPLPPPPDCNTPFYQTGCPRSCGLCEACTLTSADVSAAVDAKVETLGDTVKTDLQNWASTNLQPNVDTAVDAKMAELEANMKAEMESHADNNQASIQAALDAQVASMGETVKGDMQNWASTNLQPTMEAAVDAKMATMQDSLKTELEQFATGAIQPTVDSSIDAKLQAMSDTLKAELQDWAAESLQPIRCNPCSEILGAAPGGQAACLPKMEEVQEFDECSCACGEGTQTVRRKCVTFEEASGGACNQVTSSSHSCFTGAATTSRQCNNGPCVVTQITEKTADQGSAGTNNEISYVAYTKQNQRCNIGVVAKSNNKQRERNKKDVYTRSDTCNDICLEDGENFHYIDVTVSSTDGWLSTYIKVQVNGKTSTFKNDNWLDDRETLRFD